jgi:hypothetical protein
VSGQGLHDVPEPVPPRAHDARLHGGVPAFSPGGPGRWSRQARASPSF